MARRGIGVSCSEDWDRIYLLGCDSGLGGARKGLVVLANLAKVCDKAAPDQIGDAVIEPILAFWRQLVSE